MTRCADFGVEVDVACDSVTAMMHLPAIGRHAMWRSGDILGMQFSGPLTRVDIEGLRGVVHTVLAEHGDCYIIGDLGRGVGIEADARKYMAQWSRERTDMVGGCAVHGMSGPMRMILKLTLAAIRLLGEQQIEVAFVKDEAEAGQWIAAKRGGFIAAR